LPAAVLEAYTQAGGERAASWANTLAGGRDDAAPDPRPAPSTDRAVAVEVLELLRKRPGTAEVETSMRALLAMLEDLDSGLDEAFAVVKGRMAAQNTGRSSSGHVGAKVSGAGEIVSVEYDERWLAFAHAFNVSRETSEAIHDGLRQVTPTDPDSLLAGTTLGRLQRLAKDPTALAEYLRERG